MKKVFLYAAMGFAILSGCKKDKDNGGDGGGKQITTITATAPDDGSEAKVALTGAGRNVLGWAVGDKLYVAQVSTANTALFDAAYGVSLFEAKTVSGKTATFEMAAGQKPLTVGQKYVAYHANNYAPTLDMGRLEHSAPGAITELDATGFAEAHKQLAFISGQTDATAAGAAFVFRHLMALVECEIWTDDAASFPSFNIDRVTLHHPDADGVFAEEMFFNTQGAYTGGATTLTLTANLRNGNATTRFALNATHRKVRIPLMWNTAKAAPGGNFTITLHPQSGTPIVFTRPADKVLAAGMIYTMEMKAVAAPAKTVTVGAQDRTLTAGTASAFNYTISTTGIAQGTDGTVQWYSTSAGTGTPISAPAGVSVYTGVASAALGGEAYMMGNTTAATPAGTYYFRATIDGAQSNVATLVIGAAAKTVSVGAQNGTLTQGTAGLASHVATTTNIAQGTTGTAQWYSTSAGTGTPISAPAGVTMTVATVAANGVGGTVTNTTATAPAGTYYFRVTYDGVQSSNVGTLVISAAGAKTITVGAVDGSGIVAGVASGTGSSARYSVTHTGIPNGTYSATANNLPSGVTVGYLEISSSGSHNILLQGSASTVAGTHTNRTITFNIGGESVTTAPFTLVITAIDPTGISFNPDFYVYTWYGKTTDLGMTITPANADRSKITWETPATNFPHVINISSTGTGSAEPHIEGTNPNGSSADKSEIFVKAKLPNGNEASIVLRTKFVMNIFFSNPAAPELFMRGEPYNWKREEPNLRYVRAYYAANATQWSSSGSYLNFETDLSKIQNANYTITSSDPDITVERDLSGDALNWMFRRTNASITKAVTLTITVGSQTYKQVINLLD